MFHPKLKKLVGDKIPWGWSSDRNTTYIIIFCCIIVESRFKMSRMLLQLSLCIVTVVQLTSSLSTNDVNQQEIGGRMDEDVTQFMSRIEQMLNQLHRDVAELRDEIRQKTAAG